MAKVAINGLGRIGRATLKILHDHPDLELVAVNDLVPPDTLAYLLNYDSAYGRAQQRAVGEEGALHVGEWRIRVCNEKDPANLPWKDLQVDLVFECTGVFTKQEELEKHIQAGARFAILSAPAKSGDTPTVVHRVNTPGDPTPSVYSCASCTTNCITPIMEVLKRRIGVTKATMTTIHAYTSSQQIVDGPSKKLRRGRAGAVNLVPTSTGAAQATAKALPDIAGKFDGVAVRCPVAVGSIADIVCVAERDTSVDEVNRIFREEAASDQYEGVLGVSDEPLVSADIVGDSRAAIVDLEMTQVVDRNLVKVMGWYDNEWGYASQMVKSAVETLREQR